MSGVLIVGGGLIGTSIAWRLAQTGAQVTLADAGNLGGEASPAGAGMLSPGGEFDKPSVWLDLGIESMRLYPAFVEELRAETGVAIDFQICGCMKVGAHRAPSHPGIRVEQKPEGVFYPDEGIVDPADLLRALRCACEARRVRLLPERVSNIESNDFAAVVIAAGAWSGQIQVTHGTKRVELPSTIPVKGHLVGFQFAAGALGPFRRQEHTYVLQRASGFMIAGSNEEDAGFDTRIDAAVCQDVHQRAARLFPPLKDAVPVKRWIGFRPRSADADAPHMERVTGTNVWLAYGHYRNGILLTPLTADRIAADIASSL
jgi:glycine oxidase